VLNLPWPDPGLNPNKRIDRRALIGAKQRQKSAWWALAKAARFSFGHMAKHGLHIRLTFHPPDKRRRDLDNLHASCKAGIDGFSQAIGIDDNLFSYTLRFGDPVKGGAVVLEVGAEPAFVPFRGQIS
jgi:crossover junction endodeoxyribonuclease RusA